MAADMAAEDSTSGDLDVSAVNEALSEAKMIYTGDLSLETREFDDAVAALDALVDSLGGYYEARELYQWHSSARSLCATVRVPAAKFEDFLTQAGDVAHATSCNRYSQNVSEDYYDISARLQTQQTKLDRLQTLLAQAESMEDIISLESAISDTELQIEYLTGSLRSYDSQVDYSTVTVNLDEVSRLSTDQEPTATFSQRFVSALGTGFTRGVSGAEDFVLSLARNWVSLLVFAAVVVVVALVLRHFWRRRKAVKPVRPETPEKPENEDKKDGR
jgi:hypothetical protein